MKTKEKELASFSVPWEEREDFEPDIFGVPQLVKVDCEPYICLPQRQTWHAFVNFAGQTVLTGSSGDIIVWDFSTPDCE